MNNLAVATAQTPLVDSGLLLNHHQMLMHSIWRLQVIHGRPVSGIEIATMCGLSAQSMTQMLSQAKKTLDYSTRDNYNLFAEGKGATRVFWIELKDMDVHPNYDPKLWEDISAPKKSALSMLAKKDGNA